MSFPPPIQSHQIQHTSATKLPYRLHNYLSSGSGRTEEELDGSLPECHARGSRAPSTRFRPGYRPGRCGSRCTPSWRRRKGGAAAAVGNGREGGSFESRREASTKTPVSAVLGLGFRCLPLGSLYRTERQPGPRWSAGERRGRYFLRWSPYSFDCFDGSGFSSSRPCNGRLVRSDIFRFVGDTFLKF